MILLMLLLNFGDCVKKCKKQKDNKQQQQQCINNCIEALNKKLFEEIELDELEKQLSILKKIQEQEQKRKQQQVQEVDNIDNSNDYEIGGREI